MTESNYANREETVSNEQTPPENYGFAGPGPTGGYYPGMYFNYQAAPVSGYNTVTQATPTSGYAAAAPGQASPMGGYNFPGQAPPAGGYAAPGQAAPMGGYGAPGQAGALGGYGTTKQASPMGGFRAPGQTASMQGYGTPGMAMPQGAYAAPGYPTGPQFIYGNQGYQKQTKKAEDDAMNYAGYQGTYGAGGANMMNFGYAYNYPPYYQPMYGHDHPHHGYYHYYHPYHHAYNPYYGGTNFGMNQAGPYYGGANYNMYQNNPYGYGPMGFWQNIWNPGYLSYLLRSPRLNNFFRGVGILTIGLLLAPSVARALRPLAVSAVEGALSVSEEVKNIFADAKEDVDDIFAEAKWDDENKRKS